jgi:uncharacterized protein
MAQRKPSKNVLGEPLSSCSDSPKTGYFRNGCCDTSDDDTGCHTVCTLMTEDFLAFSKKHGNDLSTPRPEYGFVGLQPGDRWCLCASRFQEAVDAGCAPNVVLAATHMETLAIVRLHDLMERAVDVS